MLQDAVGLPGGSLARFGDSALMGPMPAEITLQVRIETWMHRSGKTWSNRQIQSISTDRESSFACFTSYVGSSSLSTFFAP